MSLHKLGAEITEHHEIDEIFPRRSHTLDLDVDARNDDLIVELDGLVFPREKLMWPIFRVYDLAADNWYYERRAAVRSMRDKLYTPDKVYSLTVKSQYTSWVYVVHVVGTELETHMAGFVTSLLEVSVKLRNDDSILSMHEWMQLKNRLTNV